METLDSDQLRRKDFELIWRVLILILAYMFTWLVLDIPRLPL
jgi:predicted nucleic acid-binding Zn ribbon protein